jgi:hypothetical protein
MMRTFVIAGAQ